MTFKNVSQNKPFKLKNLKIKEFWSSRLFRYLIYLLTIIVALGFAILIAFVIYQSTPVFQEFSFWEFLSSTVWKPGKNGSTGASYGIAMIMLMTFILLAISMLFAIPLTIFSTLFIAEYLSEPMQKKVMAVVKLLASVPSVIFGLFARDQIGYIFQLMGAPNNDNLMVAAVTMTFMAAPTMISISYNAVRSVPEGYRLGSLALGISKEKTTFKIIRKSANPQIITAIILGMARVIGETMAIMMIAGNSTGGLITNDGLSGFLFSSIRTLSATIGLEMTENSGSIHKSALFAIGMILFIIVFFINIIIIFVTNAESWKNSWNKKRDNADISDSTSSFANRKIVYDNQTMKMMISAKTENKLFKKMYSATMLLIMWIATAIVIAFTFWILGDVLIKGLIGLRQPGLFMSIDGGGGILAALSTTLLLVICVLMFSIPLALGTAIYLSEFANKKALSTRILKFTINLLASTPSIIFGIFGLSIFITLLGLPFSVLAAALTMTMVVMPMLISNFESALQQVPEQYREAGTGLGFNKTKILMKITLPNAMEGIVTGTILAMAKIIGESAPIYLTLGTDIQLPTDGFLSQGTTLTTSIYMIVAEGIPGQTQDTLYLLSLITIAFIILLNSTAGNISALVVEQTKALKTKVKAKNKNVNDQKTIRLKKPKPSLISKSKAFPAMIRSKIVNIISYIRAIPAMISMWHKRNVEYRRMKKGKKRDK